MEKKDSINEPGYDWSVYNFSYDATSGQHEGTYRQDAYPYNGWANTPPS